MAKKDAMRRRALIMLLLAPGATGVENEPVDGVTRLQKILFLISQDADLKKYLSERYEFAAYKYGPFSGQIYDDIQYLDSFGLLESTTGIPKEVPRVEGKATLPSFLMATAMSNVGRDTPDRFATDAESADLADTNELYLNDVLGPEKDVSLISDEKDRYETRKYSLSVYGMSHARQMEREVNKTNKSILKRIRRIKTEFNQMNLRDLLRHVYVQHKGFTVNSTILDELFN